MDDDIHFEETIARFWVVRQHTTVHPDGVSLSVSPLPFGDRDVSAAAIEAATATSYSPTTYNGWHWGVRRTLGGNVVYRLRGSQGVELQLDDGTRIFVGSESPDELHAAVEEITTT